MKTENEPIVEEQEPEDVSEILKVLAPHWQTIAGGVLLCFLAAAAYAFFTNSRDSAREAGWAAYLGATANRDPVALEALADGNIGNVSAFARQAAAQAKLIEASSAVYTNRQTAQTGFTEASAAFEQAITQAGNNELIKKRSIWGLGQAREGLNDLAKAKQAYQQILDTWPDTPLAKQAQRRIESLDDPKTKEFYDWFFAQKPPAAKLPASGAIPNLPFETPGDTFTVPDPASSETGSSDAVGTTDVDGTTDSEDSTDVASPFESPATSDLIDESATGDTPATDAATTDAATTDASGN